MLDKFENIVRAAKEQKKLIAVTHDGVFHTDELSCTAILMMYFDQTDVSVEVLRTRDESRIPTGDNVIIYDFGGGILDHHDDDKAKIIDGRKLSSIGKLWRFGKIEFMERFGINERMWDRIDKNLWKPIDITDNSSKMNPLTFCINAIRNTSQEGKKWSDCLNSLIALYSRVFESHRNLQEETKLMKNLPTIRINNKTFRFSEEWCSGFDEDPNVVGIIWKHEDGTYKIRMFGRNELRIKGIKNGTDPDIIYVNSSGRNGQVRKIKDFQRII